MKVITSDKTNSFSNGSKCKAIEYPLGDPDINIAVIHLTGRYPSEGRAMNQKCKEIGYVAEGSGEVVIEGKNIKLSKGDVVLIEPGERFYWNGTMTIFMPCSPAWSPEQHKEVE